MELTKQINVLNPQKIKFKLVPFLYSYLFTTITLMSMWACTTGYSDWSTRFIVLALIVVSFSLFLNIKKNNNKHFLLIGVLISVIMIQQLMNYYSPYHFDASLKTTHSINWIQYPSGLLFFGIYLFKHWDMTISSLLTFTVALFGFITLQSKSISYLIPYLKQWKTFLILLCISFFLAGIIMSPSSEYMQKGKVAAINDNKASINSFIIQQAQDKASLLNVEENPWREISSNIQDNFECLDNFEFFKKITLNPKSSPNPKYKYKAFPTMYGQEHNIDCLALPYKKILNYPTSVSNDQKENLLALQQSLILYRLPISLTTNKIATQDEQIKYQKIAEISANKKLENLINYIKIDPIKHSQWAGAILFILREQTYDRYISNPQPNPLGQSELGKTLLKIYEKQLQKIYKEDLDADPIPYSSESYDNIYGIWTVNYCRVFRILNSACQGVPNAIDDFAEDYQFVPHNYREIEELQDYQYYENNQMLENNLGG